MQGLHPRQAEVDVPAVVVMAGQEAPEVEYATDATPAAQRPARGLWWRLRRLVR